MNHLQELTPLDARSTSAVEDRDLNLLAPKEVRDMLEETSDAPVGSIGLLRHDNVEFINNFVFASVEEDVEEYETEEDEELEDDEEYEEVDDDESEEEGDEYEYVDEEDEVDGEEEYEYELSLIHI